MYEAEGTYGSASPPRKNRESVRESYLANDKMQPSSTIIFSVANAMMGPSVLLLPLKFIDIGLLSSTIVALVIGLISYRTCDLTQLHTKLHEIEYITAINRIMGKGWMYVYFVNSVVILWMAGIIYFLGLCDVVYSAINLMFDNRWPDEDTFTFNTFSYQYIGIIIMAMIGWLFFLPKLGKILDLTEKGIYCIIAEALFLIFLGIKALANGEVKFAFHTDNTNQEVAFVTSKSITYTIGVFAMAFCIHNAIVAIVRKSRNPAKNSRDIGYAYLITFSMYIVTGFFGAMGLYTKSKPEPNTVLNDKLYQGAETSTVVLVIITQFMCAFQLITVLPVVNNIVRTQLFIMIWGEDGVPPKAALPIFNAVYIVTYLLVQIFNISPNTVMSYSGAFIGFVIIYLLPIGIHLKTIYLRQKRDSKGYSSLNEPRDKYGEDNQENLEIASFIENKEKVNYPIEYGLHGIIMAVGVYIFVFQIVALA